MPAESARVIPDRVEATPWPRSAARCPLNLARQDARSWQAVFLPQPRRSRSRMYPESYLSDTDSERISATNVYWSEQQVRWSRVPYVGLTSPLNLGSLLVGDPALPRATRAILHP